MPFLDRSPLIEKLNSFELSGFADVISHLCQQRFQIENHGSLAAWQAAWNELPEWKAQFELQADAVAIRATDQAHENAAFRETLKQTLMRFHPWRKGPWEVFGVAIDSEWRSNWKWDRMAKNIDFRGKRILDVGCGNGYYGWRMLGHGADFVLGCEPFLLSVAQFEIFRRYWLDIERHFVVPLSDAELPNELNFFDLTLSMGVLYHHVSPIQHLQRLWGTLNKNGQLVIETIVLEGLGCEVLVPEARYAKMRNVWFIPSLPLLERWLRRTGFQNIRVLDTSRTTAAEQRRTDWMTFESLADYLSPENPKLTIEGYPAPVRAMILADKKI